MNDAQAAVLIAACVDRLIPPPIRAWSGTSSVLEIYLNELIDAGLITAGPALRPHDTLEALVEVACPAVATGVLDMQRVTEAVGRTRERTPVTFGPACCAYVDSGDLPWPCGLPVGHDGAHDPDPGR